MGMTDCNIRQYIGTQLRNLRESKGLTTRSLAELSGVGQSHIVRIEAGKYNIRLDILERLTTALGAAIKIMSKSAPNNYICKFLLLFDKFCQYLIHNAEASTPP
jgi:transcriptional regulator with XRE-family HTH domain